MSPTARTLDALRRDGWTACVVERWLPRVNRRADAFGFADVLACKPGAGVLLVQATSWGNTSSRVKKVLGTTQALAWLAAGGRVEVWGWAKVGGRWSARKVEIVAGDLDDVSAVELTPRRRPRRIRKGERQQTLPGID